MNRKTLRLADLPVALGLAAAFVILPLAGGGGEPRALGVTVMETKSSQPLQPDRELALSGPLGDTLVEFSSNRVRVVESPCPNKICIKTGWIEKSGQVIACLPNKVVLTLSGEDEEGVDGVAR